MKYLYDLTPKNRHGELVELGQLGGQIRIQTSERASMLCYSYIFYLVKSLKSLLLGI